MNKKAKLFHLGDILSITTGRLVARNEMDGVHEILNFMTGENLFTHALIRAAEVCRPALFEQHPSLKEINGEEVEGMTIKQIDEWVNKLGEKYGDWLPVMPLVNWEQKDPIEELIQLRGSAEGISVITLSPDAILVGPKEGNNDN